MKISLGLSRKHIPCIKVNDEGIWLWQYPQYRKLKKLNLALTKTGIFTALELIERGYLYLPKFGLEGKTVLDIGACCGESADIYLKAGAKKVICIEPDADRVRYIQFNAKNLGWNVEVIAEKATTEHILKANPDLIKCDIEGYEMDLIDYLAKYPCVLEVHNYWIRERFTERGFRELTEPESMLGVCLMANEAFLSPGCK
jgi:hypothetical protein